jgi:hypothetical protein
MRKRKTPLLDPQWPLVFSRSQRFLRRGFFTHCLSKEVGFGLKFSRRGWQADAGVKILTSDRSKCRARVPTSLRFTKQIRCQSRRPSVWPLRNYCHT